MEKAFVAQRVATKLFTTEAAVDQAMVEATELMADLLKKTLRRWIWMTPSFNLNPF